MSLNKYGWRPDKPDHRDFLFTAEPQISLPASIDLQGGMPKAIYDQLQLGSCTANAIGCHFQFNRIKAKKKSFVPSRLFIYYGERDIEGSIGEDAGAEIRDGIKVVNKLGAPPETDWKYDISKFALKPPDKAYTDGLKYRAATYKRINQNLQDMQGCLAEGFPFVIGFTVYDSFESDVVTKTGVVPMPGGNEQVLGGHAVLVCGYDNSTQRFKVRNSWGKKWGMGGYFTMPYDYLLNTELSSDFWTIRL